MPSYPDVDAYLNAASPTARPVLQAVREAVARALPHATETIAYQMPAFRTERCFFYFGAFKKHLGIYPPLHDDAELVALTQPFRGPKGNLSFPYDEPIPYELITRVAVALAAQYERER
jgi:uncharacterized protein YdhG (YjbR/CyaY superfamily)